MKYPEAWRSRAACRYVDTAVFYPEAGNLDQRGFAATAKAICATCPVKTPCDDHAPRHEKHGIWAGRGANERIRIRKERGIQVHEPKAIVTRSAVAS
jgi:WhiB family redox-sensing transcriptional regulator